MLVQTKADNSLVSSSDWEGIFGVISKLISSKNNLSPLSLSCKFFFVLHLTSSLPIDVNDDPRNLHEVPHKNEPKFEHFIVKIKSSKVSPILPIDHDQHCQRIKHQYDQIDHQSLILPNALQSEKIEFTFLCFLSRITMSTAMTNAIKFSATQTQVFRKLEILKIWLLFSEVDCHLFSILINCFCTYKTSMLVINIWRTRQVKQMFLFSMIFFCSDRIFFIFELLWFWVNIFVKLLAF